MYVYTVLGESPDNWSKGPNKALSLSPPLSLVLPSRYDYILHGSHHKCSKKQAESKGVIEIERERGKEEEEEREIPTWSPVAESVSCPTP